MYSDRKRSRRPILLWILLLLMTAGCTVIVLQDSETSLREESAAAMEDAVRRCALQCYTVEGVYPPNLRYLEANYGLQINTRDFYVVYEAFSSNLPPDVRIVPR